MPFLDVFGDPLHFEDDPQDRSDLPLLLFVHGSCGGSGQWKRLVGTLGSDFRKVRVDLPGMGQSAPFPLERVWTPEHDANTIAALIDYLDRPVHFVGHSAGCIFSWPALQARSDRILSLTLFEPVFFRLLDATGDPLFAWPEFMATTYRRHVDAGDPERAVAFFFDHWAGREGAWETAPDKVRDMMRVGGGRLYYEVQHLQPSGPTPMEALERPPAPTLLVQGEKTQDAVQAICDIVADARPGTRRVTVNGAGHMAPFTHAEVIAPVLREHILSAQGARAATVTS